MQTAPRWRPAKLWCDTESAAENDELLAWLGGAEGSLERLGVALAPGYTLSKLLWTRRHHPRLFERIAHILLPHDYLNHWLTGECRTEYGDASGTGYFDVRRAAGTWSCCATSTPAVAWSAPCPFWSRPRMRSAGCDPRPPDGSACARG